MPTSDTPVAVLGAGSWGTAIAKVLGDQGMAVRLWARTSEQAARIESDRRNARYLPDCDLGPNLVCTADLEAAVSGVRTAYVVVPSHGLRDLAQRLSGLIPTGVPIVSATKGIENGTLMLMTEVLADELPEHAEHLCALGGPSFAAEVAAAMPTAVCVGAKRQATADRVQSELSTPRFRVYSTDDLVGVELGGALKNVIAIAVGAADGMGFGHNARAGLITRGIAEITRLGTKLGAHPQTLAGLSGLGDLVLTCTGDLSRNRHVGMELGAGRRLDDILGDMRMVAEGVKTAQSAHELARREGIDMPITAEVYRALYEDKPPPEALQSLLSRSLRPERD